MKTDDRLFPATSTKFLPDLPLLAGIVQKKPTYWAARPKDPGMES